MWVNYIQFDCVADNSSATFAPPTPEELLKLHYASDKSPPSQSKRWTDPSLLKAFQKTVKKGKDLPSPIESVDARRSGRSRPAPLPVKSQKPISATSIKPEKDVKRPDSSPRRRVSIAELRSMSPRDPAHSPGPAGFPGKRRSTMNSRDSAYEEAQIRAALEASRQEMFNSQERELDPEDVEGGAADEDTEMERAERRDAKKGKRKRDGDDTGESSADGGTAGLMTEQRQWKLVALLLRAGKPNTPINTRIVLSQSSAR